MSPQRVESPCVRLCTLDEKDICVGCHRSLEEITGWSAMSDTERLAALERARQRKQESLERRRSRTKHD